MTPTYNWAEMQSITSIRLRGDISPQKTKVDGSTSPMSFSLDQSMEMNALVQHL